MPDSPVPTASHRHTHHHPPAIFLRSLAGALAALALLLVVSGCASETDAQRSGEQTTAQRIVDGAIETHGSPVLDQAVLAFDFRGRHYISHRENGRFRYERQFTDSTGQIQDVLTNDSLYREVNGERVPLDSALRASIESGVNSVIYFALLPLPLNDPAVQKHYLGETTIHGEPYHEVEVTFEAEGGGRDHEDRYVYWIHKDRHTVDYLAYTYDTDEKGTRFRVATNPRTIEGVRFADYENYEDPTIGDEIERYEESLESGRLRKVSDILTENITLSPLER